jgi:membrane-associated phospholipid phosphatase
MLSAALAAGALLLPSPAGAGEPGHRENLPVIETAVGEEAADDRDDGRRTLELFPENLVRGVGGVFSSESLTPLLVGGAAAGLATLLDDEVRDAIADEGDDLANFADDNLGPTGLGVLTLGLFIGGRFSDDDRFRAMSYDLGVAALVNLGYTAVLKAAVSRERPNGSDDDSFPSGHTSNAFALASVADAHYGKEVGIPAYLLASLIGASRLRSNAHWLSDVVAGAALGYIVGRSVVRQNNEPLGSAGSLIESAHVMPILAPGFQGVQVAMTF